MAIWELFVSLGVPGLALGIFYMLFRKFNWRFPKIPSKWVGPIVVLFMVLTASLVFYTLRLWAPNLNDTHQSNDGSKIEQKLAGGISNEEGELLAGVIVSLLEFNLTDTTKSNGRFKFDVTSTKQKLITLEARKDGYKPYKTNATLGNTNLEFVLQRKHSK